MGQPSTTDTLTLGLTVQPREGWRSYEWHVAHSIESGLARSGSASTVNFAKGAQ